MLVPVAPSKQRSHPSSDNCLCKGTLQFVVFAARSERVFSSLTQFSFCPNENP